MKLGKASILLALAALAPWSSCSEAPTVADDAQRSTVQEEQQASQDDGPLQWRTHHSGPLQPWMQHEFDEFQASINGLVSRDPAVAQQAFGDLMARDPNFYPAVVRALTEGGSDEAQALIDECLSAYWEQYGGRSERGPGGGGEVTFEIRGKVTTAPGSKVTIENWVEDIPIDVSGKTFPINIAESAHTCPNLVGTSTTTVTGIRVPVSFTVPGWGPVTGIKIDIVLIIDITVILRYYECKGGGEVPGEDHLERSGEHSQIEKLDESQLALCCSPAERELVVQWDRLAAVSPARL